ncbi:DUF4419 domain-containing protein [Longispora urticae]
MRSFPVDDVTCAPDLLPTRPLGELFTESLVVGGDTALPVLEPDGVHPLLSAVSRAFAEHRPLVLSPDAVWLTIAQGLAQHVRLHAEDLRGQLVTHRGAKRLTVPVLRVPTDAPGWAAAVEQLGELLAAEVGELFECDFSTSTDVDLVAGRVVMMDVYSPYFAYVLMCVCGIPSITLTGTVEDWRRIRQRVDALDRFGLSTWQDSLAPILDQFVRAAGGGVDTGFWQRIYNPVDAYGGDRITGWAARFYPYLLSGGSVEHPNPLLDLPLDQPRDLTVAGQSYAGPGIGSTAVPATLSRATVTIQDSTTGVTHVVALHAGLVGVAQDADGGLRPVAGWHLTHAPLDIDQVVDTILAGHGAEPPGEGGLSPFGASAETVGLYRRLGSATLASGWRVLPTVEHTELRGGDHLLHAMVALPDGRSIASTHDYRSDTTHWALCRAGAIEDPDFPRERALADDPADVPLLGTSLALILRAGFEPEPDLTRLETGRLIDLDN